MLTKSQTTNYSFPRAIVFVNGENVRFNSFRVEHSGFSAADSFEVDLPFFVTQASGKEKILANGPDFATMLLRQDSIPVKILVGYSKNPDNYTESDLTQVIDGYVDTARWHFDENGESVTITGRNVVGKMIDTKINDKFPNLTASQIASMYAGKYELYTSITPTRTLAGTYYNNTSAVISSSDMSEWDMLLYLAKQEDYICRVKGNTLYFGPFGTVTKFLGDAAQYTWGKDIFSLDMERSPHGAKDIKVLIW